MSEDKYKQFRLANFETPYQGKYKRVLCVCTTGLLRSPTAAVVLQSKYSFNTRAAGLDKDYALVVVDENLLTWAEEIVCMSSKHRKTLSKLTKKPIINLAIPDGFDYMEETLQQHILNNYEELNTV